ncbi:MarR family transcriptional regulator [Alphaproteobacteria bacterium]|nr:MarR family transcriptional regulator [Alphaproteobacteria bacterium]
MTKIRGSAKKAMTTPGQKGCYVIDHMVGALADHSSASIRRAVVLVDIDQHEGTTQAEIMERTGVGKSALNRDIDWMFNNGCIRRHEAQNDGRKIKLRVSAFSQTHVDGALDYFEGNHENLKTFLEGYIRILKDDKATLRDAKILATLHEKRGATKQEVVENLYQGSSATENRAILRLIEEGLVRENESAA